MGPKQVLLLQVRVDLGVMAMKEYSTFPKAAELERHHQVRFSVISKILNAEGSYSFAKVQLVYSTATADMGVYYVHLSFKVTISKNKVGNCS